MGWGRYPEYELCPGGSDIMVDAANSTAYVAAVVDATLGTGVSRQACRQPPTHSTHPFCDVMWSKCTAAQGLLILSRLPCVEVIAGSCLTGMAGPPGRP